MSGKIKTLKRKMEVQEITLNFFCMLDLNFFQNLLWMYEMAWTSVRFPGLKFCRV